MTVECSLICHSYAKKGAVVNYVREITPVRRQEVRQRIEFVIFWTFLWDFCAGGMPVRAYRGDQ